MIPPVEERQVRPCYEYRRSDTCVFFFLEECWAHCNLREEIVWQDADTMKLNRVGPCIYHHTAAEMLERIDSGAADLKRLQFVPPKEWEEYDGTLLFNEVGTDNQILCMDDTVFYMLDPEYDHGDRGAV